MRCDGQDDRHHRYSDRVFNINIIQLYASTNDKGNEEVKKFYSQVNKIFLYTKNLEITMEIGDLNANIGKGRDEIIIESFDLGHINEREARLVQFCREKQIIKTNIFLNYYHGDCLSRNLLHISLKT